MKCSIYVLSASLVIALCAQKAVQGQESDSTSPQQSGDDIQFNLSGGSYYTIYSTDDVIVPTSWGNPPIPRPNNDDNILFGNTYTDDASVQPMRYLAAYVRGDVRASIVDAFYVDASLVAEHRGLAYGVHDLNRLKVYPEILATLDTAFNVFDQSYEILIKAGHLGRTQTYEGLTIHNIDADGVYFELRRDRLGAAMKGFPDLSRTIGLGIWSLLDLKLFLDTVSLGSDATGTFRIGATDYYESNEEFGYNLSASVSTAEGPRLYGQISTRNGAFADDASMAGLIGLEWKWPGPTHGLSFVGEYRYFGSGFNEGRDQQYVSYRDNSFSQDALFPLEHYERPFSQWSVYTHNNLGGQVHGFTSRINGRVGLWEDARLKGSVDVTWVDAAAQLTWLLPFYTLQLEWAPVDRLAIGCGITNKVMDLERPFQTFQALEYPGILATARWRTEF